MAGFTVRTRFAPSPTGELHIGNARTALFNWLFTRHYGGRFILRIEDTDTERSSPLHEANILKDLKWLGLQWDEGPDVSGEKGPYRQSERLGLYRAHAERLLDAGLAYRCYCTKERLEGLRAEQAAMSVPSRYDGRCRDLKPAQIPPGVVPVIRFKVPAKTVTFYDGVHGLIYFDTKTIGDFVIMGSDGVAAYNFAVVVDDALMEITHVIRGDDHISNTPRHMLLFEALGFKVPLYTHLPLVLGEDRVPLSKRDAGTTLARLRDEGYLPEAIVNSVARLGWSPGEDLLTLEELYRAFSLEKLSKSSSVFDKERLKHYNKWAIAGKDPSTLASMLYPEATDTERLRDAIEAVKGNAATLPELQSLVQPFVGEPEFTEEALKALSAEGAADVIKALNEAVGRTPVLDDESFKAALETVKEATGIKGKALFMPIRSALTGMTEGIELVKVMKLLGRETVIRRLGASL